jgi:hypothetical protein
MPNFGFDQAKTFSGNCADLIAVLEAQDLELPSPPFCQCLDRR